VVNSTLSHRLLRVAHSFIWISCSQIDLNTTPCNGLVKISATCFLVSKCLNVIVLLFTSSFKNMCLLLLLDSHLLSSTVVLLLLLFLLLISLFIFLFSSLASLFLFFSLFKTSPFSLPEVRTSYASLTLMIESILSTLFCWICYNDHGWDPRSILFSSLLNQHLQR